MANIALINGSDINGGDGSLQGLSDSFSCSDAFSPVQLVSLADAIAFSDSALSVLVETTYSISDTTELADSITWGTVQSQTDTVSLSDTFSIGLVIEAIADALGIEDSFEFRITATATIADIFGIEDEFALQLEFSLADTIEFADAFAERIRFIREILSSFELTDSFSSTFQIQLLVSDSFEIEDSWSKTVQVLLEWSDEFSIIGQFSIDGETYLAWAINPRTAAAYKLSYYLKFNSIERIGGKNLLCAPEGIYEVGGDDDDGTAIDYFLKTGLTDFADPERHLPGENLKQLLDAYLLFSSEGDTLLKITTTRRGKSVEKWFKCKAHPEVVSKHRVPLTDSLRSVMYQFELKPLHGKPAAFTEIEVIPLFLNRRL